MTRFNSPGVSLPTTSSAFRFSERVESRLDGLRHAAFGGPFGPSAIPKELPVAATYPARAARIGRAGNASHADH
jgi:hypothetical protein